MSGIEAIFGLAASGAGLLSLSIQLVECATRLKRIYHAAQDAPRTIARLVSGLEIMAMALRQLEQHRQQGNPAEALLDRCIVECQLSTVEIQMLVNKMEGCMTKHARLGGKLYTAFKQRDVKELLHDLERAKSSLELAYMMYRDHAHSDMLALLQAQVMEGKASLSQQLTVLAHTSTVSHSEYLAVPVAPTSSTNADISVGYYSDQTDTDKTSEHPNGALPGESSLRRPVMRDNGKCHFRASLRFPSWLSHRIFHFALTRAQCGWSVHLRTYNIVANGSNQLIFRYCGAGNLAGMRKLFESGAATPLDVVQFGTYYQTLLEVAAFRGRFEVCHYLLSQTTWPDQDRVLKGAFSDCCFLPERAKSGAISRLFLADPEFDVDLDDTSPSNRWWESCDDLEILDLILQAQSSSLDSRPFQARFDLASRLTRIEPSGFLRWMAVPASDERLATVTNNDGTTILHHVVHNLFRMWNGEEPRSDELHGWIDLGISALRNGANPLGHVGKGRSLSWRTPLLEFFTARFYCEIRDFQQMLDTIRLWANIIQQAGLNLCDYGAKECQVWKSLRVTEGNNGWWFKNRFVEGVQLVYGATPEDWTVKISYYRQIDVYRLQPPPGAFFEETPVPRTIAWQPTDSERDEGPWRRVESKKWFARERDLRDIPSYPEEPFKDLVNTTQDDSGVIILMQYRASRTSRIPSRSHSQPPCLRRREVSFCNVQRSDKRYWLPGYHLCPLDSTWRFDCTDPNGYEEENALGDNNLWEVFPVRSCLKGIAHGPLCVQQTRIWQYHSFLAQVAYCQDHMTAQVGMESAEHGDECPCPQGCRSVHLSQLNVPEDLRPYHPYRHYEDEIDSV